MSNILKYKGYIGSIECSVEDEILHGKIECINDLVTYEAENIKDLKTEFELAVDDYLSTCASLSKSPDKSMSGSFNIRIGKENHKKAFNAAKEKGLSLNDYVKIAVEEKLADKKEIHIHIENKSMSVSGTYETKKPQTWQVDNKSEVRH